MRRPEEQHSAHRGQQPGQPQDRHRTDGAIDGRRKACTATAKAEIMVMPTKTARHPIVSPKNAHKGAAAIAAMFDPPKMIDKRTRHARRRN